MTGFIKVATIISTHGLGGMVKVFSEIESFERMLQDGKLLDESYNVLKASKVKKTKNSDVFIVLFDGMHSIDDAELVIRKKIFIQQEHLANKDEILVSDLIGIDVFVGHHSDDRYIGKVLDIVSYGNGPMMEMVDKNNKKLSELIPANFDFIESINLDLNYLVLKEYTIY